MLYPFMELEVSLLASHPFLHCRTPKEWDWIELLMGLLVSLCVPTEGRATEQEDGQKYLPSSRAPHRRYLPSRKVVLALISA